MSVDSANYTLLKTHWIELLDGVLVGSAGGSALGAVKEIWVNVERERVTMHAPTPAPSSSTAAARHFDRVCCGSVDTGIANGW